jgi:hypothetical protein
MNPLRILALGGIAALTAMSAGTGAHAVPLVALEQGAAGLGSVSDVRHRGRPHRAYHGHPRQRIVVYPDGYADPYAYGPYREPRGFDDPGFAYHGNITGCAVDLGYGRYETCDK